MRVILEGVLYSRAGSVTGFTVHKITIKIQRYCHGIGACIEDCHLGSPGSNLDRSIKTFFLFDISFKFQKLQNVKKYFI